MSPNWKKGLIIAAIVVTLGLSSYIVVHNFVGATASKKKNRNIIFMPPVDGDAADTTDASVLDDTSSNASGKLITANDSIIEVPALQDAFYSSGTQANSVKLGLQTIGNNYGQYIANIASFTNVKQEIIKSFIWVESAGNPNVISGASVGLMQVNPDTAHDTIRTEYLKGRLNDFEEAIIQNYLGSVDFSNVTVTSDDLKKPELNILIGTMFLGQLMDEETYTSDTYTGAVNDWINAAVDPIFGQQKYIRLDFVIMRYNQGAYIFSSRQRPQGAVADCCPVSGSCDYIKKILGVNGTLQLLTT